MFDNLIDNLNPDKWQEIDASSKNQDNFKEYHVNRHHKAIDDTTISVMVALEDGDPQTVLLKDCKPKKDPLKEIGVIELQLNAEGTEIVGIDLNGDIVLRK